MMKEKIKKNKRNSYLGLYLFSFLQWYFSCLFQGHLICTGCEDPNQKESLAVETTADTGATTKTKTTNQGEQGATAVPVGNATEGGRMGLPLLLEEEEEEQGSGDMVWVQSPNFLDISYTCNDVLMGVLNWLYCVCVLFCFVFFLLQEFHEAVSISPPHSPAAASTIHDLSPTLWHALDIWRSIMHRGTGLRQALEGLSMCGTGLNTELWYVRWPHTIRLRHNSWFKNICQNS